MDKYEELKLAAKLPPWLASNNKNILATRVSFIRNIREYDELYNRSPKKAQRIVCERMTAEFSDDHSWDDGVLFQPAANPLLTRLLFEKQLVPPDCLTPSAEIAVAYKNDFSALCIINVTDDLEFQFWYQGMPSFQELKPAMDYMNRLDSKLGFVKHDAGFFSRREVAKGSNMKIQVFMHLHAFMLYNYYRYYLHLDENFGMEILPLYPHLVRSLTGLHLISFAPVAGLSAEGVYNKTLEVISTVENIEMGGEARLRKYNTGELYKNYLQAFNKIKMPSPNGITLPSSLYAVSMLWGGWDLGYFPNLDIANIKKSLMLCNNATLDISAPVTNSTRDQKRLAVIRKTVGIDIR